VRRLVSVAVATLLGVVAVVGGNPSAAQAISLRVKPQFFGMHDPGGDAPLSYGAVRWWDVGVTWADVEPAKGLFDFTKLDRLVHDAEARGVKATLTLGATPAWAAMNPMQSSAVWLAPGSSSPPRSQTYWTDYVTAVATRYAGRIDSYQIWNEGGLRQFWSSTPAKLAQLTALAYVAIKRADPQAKVVSSPMLPRQPQWRAWAASYLKALRHVGWPVDVFAMHSYQPDRWANPDGRVLVIKQTRAIMRSVRAPSRPLWDTETNYTSWSYVKHKITGQRAAAWVARAYLDSLRLNVRRTFWYGYNQPVPRLAVTIGLGTSAARAYNSVRAWTVGSTFTGCKASRTATGVTVTRCYFLRGAHVSRIIWASATLHTRLRHGTTVCRLTSGCSTLTSQTLVTGTPLLVR
jgi:hypothetical protein